MIGERAGVIQPLPAPPPALTDEEAREWRAIVTAMQPGYFARSHYALLVQLCRHVAAANKIAGFIQMAKSVELGKLLALQAKESASIIQLCRQMRLSHQAVVNKLHKHASPKGNTLPAPWELDADDLEDMDDDDIGDGH
jgi:hypothetical protein